MAVNSKKVLEDILKKETPLKDLAAESSFERKVPATYPGGVFDRPMGKYARIYTPTMKASIWGKPQHITLSMLKTDVFDRRYFRTKPFTLEQVVKGAFSDANKDYDDMPYSGLQRPKYGVLLEEGGRRDFQAWSENYPFPCQKTVGQIIINVEDLNGAEQPTAVMSMKNGLANINMKNSNGASLDIEYLMSMKRNIVAVNTDFGNLSNKLSFRLHRHQDQGHRRYMDENGNFIPKEERKIVFHPVDPLETVGYYDYEGDADFNGAFEPPKSGSEGRFFWITQRFPAEKTFPEGFEYIMMGFVSDPDTKVYHDELQKGLGTAPGLPIDAEGNIRIPEVIVGHMGEYVRLEKNYSYIRNAPGVAGTAVLPKAGTGSAQLYVVVVTSNETKDFFTEAKKQLLEAEKLGYKALVEENDQWYKTLYQRREEGRIVIQAPEKEKASMNEQILENVYKSWAFGHGGFCSPDPSKYEGSASYAAFDMDNQSWHSLPCYNEIFSEPIIVHNQYEPLFMWCKLVETWHEALKQKAKDIFNLPGMTIAHGYLPPVLPDPWYIENQTLDFCMEVPGQVVKALWNLWDYRGDEKFLKEHVYPILRDLAIFYEAFARRNFDGKYFHLAPVVETESWGISYKLKYATNTTAAITMFRKTLNCAIEGAKLLNLDADLIEGWREVAENLPPYPKFLVGCGEILGGNSGGMPRWTAGDHEHFTADYPAVLADEITLDSSDEDKELIVRTMDTVRTVWNESAYILVGKFKDHKPCGYNVPAILIENNEMLLDELIKEPERLLNSRSGRIHLFPVVPDWSEVSFHEMLARGGFIVSAAKDKEGIKAVVIKAKRSIPCQIMNPWIGSDIFIIDNTTGNKVSFELNTNNGQCIIFSTEADHEYCINKA